LSERIEGLRPDERVCCGRINQLRDVAVAVRSGPPCCCASGCCDDRPAWGPGVGRSAVGDRVRFQASERELVCGAALAPRDQAIPAVVGVVDGPGRYDSAQRVGFRQRGCSTSGLGEQSATFRVPIRGSKSDRRSHGCGTLGHDISCETADPVITMHGIAGPVRLVSVDTQSR
jgi:hypothetical protein